MPHPPLLIKTGAIVEVTGALTGSVVALVEDTSSVTDLPTLPGFGTGELAQVQQDAAELGIASVAIISYQPSKRGERVCFVAVRSAGGQWHDLLGQQLSITPISGPH